MRIRRSRAQAVVVLDPVSPPEAGADGPRDEEFDWATMVIEVPAVAPELDESEEVIDESLEHAAHGLAETDDDSPTWPSDDQIFAPTSEHTIEHAARQFSGTDDDSPTAQPDDQIFALLSDQTIEHNAQGLAEIDDDSPTAPPDDQIFALLSDQTIEHGTMVDADDEEAEINGTIEHTVQGLAWTIGDSPTAPPDDQSVALLSDHTVEHGTPQLAETNGTTEPADEEEAEINGTIEHTAALTWTIGDTPTAPPDEIVAPTSDHTVEPTTPQLAGTNGTTEPALHGFAWTNGDSSTAPPDDQSVAPTSDHTVEPTTPRLAGTNGTIEHTAQELAGTNGDSPAATPDEQLVAPASERGVELESEHWRERAIVWRERAIAAELVAKTLQGNVDDLRANVEDLRPKVEAAAVDDAPRAAAIAPSETPWRRFARDLYDKYLG